MQARQLIKFFRQFVDAAETGIDQCTDRWPPDADTVEVWPTIQSAHPFLATQRRQVPDPAMWPESLHAQ